MRALITGRAGFVGSAMATALMVRGYEVRGIDIAGSRGLENCLSLFRGEASEYTRYDLVVHCAAHVGGRVDIDGRAAFIGAYNAQLDAAMFEWALRTKPGRVVYFSSSAVYPEHLQGEGQHQALTEDLVSFDRMQSPPESSYGWTKYMGEYLAGLVRAEGIPVHVFRPFSGYGETQSPAYPFPAFIARALAREDPFTVWGPGTQVRDFIHITDVVRGVLAAIDQDVQGPLNLGTGVGASFVELAEMVTRVAGYTPTILTHPDKPTGVMHRVADVTRMLGVFTPRVSLMDGIGRALAAGAVAA